tara:strand:+ start:2545 stop:3084 length:540 start_codon:yes stop_codon:yes gene_type:complete
MHRSNSGDIFKHFNNRTRKNKYRTYRTYRKYSKHSKQTNKQRVVKCGIIILNEDKTKIMLVQNKYLLNENNVELWSIPKGSRKNNETYADCAMRETYEETGLQFKIKNNMLRIKINNTYYFIYKMKHTTNILIPIDTIEINKVKWFNIDDISHNKINLETKLIIKRKLHFLKKYDVDNM